MSQGAEGHLAAKTTAGGHLAVTKGTQVVIMGTPVLFGAGGPPWPRAWLPPSVGRRRRRRPCVATRSHSIYNIIGIIRRLLLALGPCLPQRRGPIPLHAPRSAVYWPSAWATGMWTLRGGSVR